MAGMAFKRTRQRFYHDIIEGRGVSMFYIFLKGAVWVSIKRHVDRGCSVGVAGVKALSSICVEFVSYR